MNCPQPSHHFSICRTSFLYSQVFLAFCICCGNLMCTLVPLQPLIYVFLFLLVLGIGYQNHHRLIGHFNRSIIDNNRLFFQALLVCLIVQFTTTNYKCSTKKDSTILCSQNIFRETTHVWY